MSSAGPLYPVNGFTAERLKGATVLVPAVSLGNVPQLAADLLVTSLQLMRVAFLGRGDTVAPFAGRDSDGIVTGGLELYGNSTSDIFVLLQRAPTLKDKKDAHVALISSLVHDHGVGLALLLTSLDAANQDDAQLMTPHQAILPKAPQPHSALERLQQLPPLRLNIDPAAAPASASTATTYPPFLPGAGLSRRVLAAIADVPSGAIAAWCVEGDNRGDARALATVALGVLGVDAQLVEPPSWAGLFGPGEGWSGGQGLDAEIYG